MAISLQRPTATIYQFPLGGRALSNRMQKEAAMEAVSSYVVYDSWYHDAAIAEDKVQPKDKPHS